MRTEPNAYKEKELPIHYQKGVTKMRFLIPTLIALLCATLVTAAPAFPIQFAGQVVVNGEVAPDGLLVTAKIDGSDVQATTTVDGQYSMTIGDPYGDRQGETVSFFVEGIDTGETGLWAYQDSEGQDTTLQIVDLGVSGDICGDNVCTSGESCSSCSADCGSCTAVGDNTGSGSNTPGSGGGGGGGGGYIPPEPEECVPDWTCSDWLDCTTGTQKRVCVDSNKCGTDEDKPVLEQECEIPEQLKTPEEERYQGVTPPDEREEEPVATEVTEGNAITGAAIGGGMITMGLAGLGVLVALIIGGFVAWRTLKK